MPLESQLLARITFNITSVSIVILLYVIFRTEKIFWFSGMTYEEAVQAGSLRRKTFAFRHLRVYGIFTVVFLLFSVIMQLFHISIWVDTVVFTAGLLFVAFFTMRIKL